MEEEKSDKKKSLRRIGSLSAYGAKKAMASKLGETKLGRSTLVKALGTEGDEIVTALKSAVSKLDHRNVAKELKQILVKWILKVVLMVQHKQLSQENAGHLGRPVTMCAERLVLICDNRKRGSRDLTRVGNELRELGSQLKTLLEPFSREKNVDKIDKLVQYYADQSFLEKLFNQQDLVEESDKIVSCIKVILAPLQGVLLDDESLSGVEMRRKMIKAELGGPSLNMCLQGTHPEFNKAFVEYLDCFEDPRPGLAFRFLLSESQYTLVSSPHIRAARGQIMYDKFVLPLSDDTGAGAHSLESSSAQGKATPTDLKTPSSSGASAQEGSNSVKVDALPPAPPQGENSAKTGPAIYISCNELDTLEDHLENGTIARSSFRSIRNSAMKYLEQPMTQFLASKTFLDYKDKLSQELSDIENTFGDCLELPST